MTLHLGLDLGGTNMKWALVEDEMVIASGSERTHGGVAGAGDLLLDSIRAELRERVRVAPIERIEVVPAELGPGAGAIGAALWAAEPR